MNNETRMTVLTVDLRNFTYHSRQGGRDRSEGEFIERFKRLCDIVKDFYELILGRLAAHASPETTTVLTVGDGVILCYRGKNHHVQAYRTAMELRERFVPFFKSANELMGERRKSTALGFGIGIHTGRFEVRHYRSFDDPNRSDPIILGDAINISTRLEGLTKDHANTNILISETTYALLAGERDLPIDGLLDFQVHEIKGFSPLRLYGVPETG